jgi:hypothetical protein
VAEFDAGVGGGELPVDLAVVGVDGVLPGGEFGVEGVDVGDAPVEALSGQRAESSISAMLSQEPWRGVWWISSRCDERRGGFECVVEGADAVGVEVVHDQHDGLGVGVVVSEQVVHLTRPVDLGSVWLSVDAAPAA